MSQNNQPITIDYAELHCLSNYSFLRGASHPQELIIQAEQLGYQALAITDECSVAGIVRAYSAKIQQQLKIKLIVGAQFRLEQGLEIVLLCPDLKAYSEMCQFITLGRRRTDKGQYRLYQQDLTRLNACLLLWRPTGDHQQDNQIGQWLSQHCQLECWIAVERLLENDEQRYLEHCRRLAFQFNLPQVGCTQVHMHTQQRQPLQDTLTAIRLGTTVTQAGFGLFSNSERYLRPLDKITKLYDSQMIAQTMVIAKRCHFDLAQISYQYPAEVVPQGYSASAYLRQLVEDGIKVRFNQGLNPDIRATIEKELKLIAEQQYEYFFLTIYDLVKFARSRQILYQGRGSAANSVVCYCLFITAVDPTQIDVLFERFISKERDEPPDIDVDFEHQRREEVIQYIYQKYGRDRAAIAATVHSFKLKGAIREVGKALAISETQLDFFIKNINRRDQQQSWQQQVCSLGLNPNSEVGRWFLRLVEQIRGFPRHLSQHVGGFVIAKGPLNELVPIENAAMPERTVIQWDKNDIETLKLLKVDVLALGMLTAIRKTFALVKQHYQISLDMAQISALGDDDKVYHMLQHADTVGVFQIESRAQMSMLPRLKPKCYYDLVIQIAIVRPGPIQGDMVHPYLRRRDGLEPVSYPSEAVKQVLERTLGVPIFQEQVIKLAMVAAGFTGGEADALRRAMARWKKTGEMQGFRTKLIDGMRQRGYEVEFAERIFKQICGFGEYGFPESHSASFALLAYVSAWLKYYYPAAFYCALLNSLPMGFYSASQLLQDAKRHGVNILPVAINHSRDDHQLVKHDQQLAILLGFRLIKGLSTAGVELILQQRPPLGFEQLQQIQQLGLNQKDLAALASSGAFEVLCGNRFQTRWQMMNDEHQLPLFADRQGSTTNEQVGSFNIQPSVIDDLIEDQQSLGLTLGLHPITILRQQSKLKRWVSAEQLAQCSHRSMVSVVGVVTGRQSPGTASGVTFMTLEDDTGNINVIIYKSTAAKQKKAFLTATIVQVNGIIEREGEVIHVIAGKLIDLTHMINKFETKSRNFH